jgi:AraC-like DNA-binding protein
VLTAQTLLEDDGIRLADVACSYRAGRGDAIEHRTTHALVFVRRGCFLRTTYRGECLLDPTLAYATTPGQEERIDHPHDGGDDCTYLELAPEVAASLRGGDPALPSRPLPTSPAVDLEHRLLLAAARRGADRHELTERAIALAAAALERDDAGRVASGRPATARARRAVVEEARERLLADPDQPLPELARRVAVSPHHLSRLFHALTGTTISRHRMRLRVRAALERLAGGERDLARVAFESGFADQAHCSRVIKAELGTTPSALRAALA